MTWLIPILVAAIAWVLFMRELNKSRALEVHRRTELVVRFDVDLEPFLRAMETVGRSLRRAAAIVASPAFRSTLEKIAEAEKARMDAQLAGIRVVVESTMPANRVYLIDEEAIRRPPELER